MNMDIEANYLSVRQISEYFNIPIRTVQRLSKEGKIKSFKIGGQWRYPKEIIVTSGLNYNVKQTVNPTPSSEIRAFASPAGKRRVNFLKAKQVSEYLKISVRTIRYLSKQGKIKSYKIGGQWRYLKDNIDKYRIGNTDFSKEPAGIPAEAPQSLNAGALFIERRIYPRVNTNLRCRYSISLQPFKNIEDIGIVKNIGGGGIFLFIEDNRIDKVCVGDPIDLVFVLPPDIEKDLGIYTQGKIVRKEESGVGIRFKNINEESKNRIVEYAG